MKGKRGTSDIFVTFVCFIAILGIFSYLFDVELSKTSVSDLKPGTVTEEEKGWIENFFDFTQKIPIIGAFVPLIKLMSFQYENVPPLLTIILDLMTIMGAFVVVSMLGKK